MLRNEIAHHAPISHRHLNADQVAIMAMLGFVDAPLADLVALYGPVPAVLPRARSCDEQGLAFCQLWTSRPGDGQRPDLVGPRSSPSLLVPSCPSK
ncbi:hypothetical protein [Nonomuraea sp. NPDC049646]|uniref:hypothetical protein n=1 Tax=unclassified Nonomuraea TaxID=2593643 RepID=UPI00379B815E